MGHSLEIDESKHQMDPPIRMMCVALPYKSHCKQKVEESLRNIYRSIRGTHQITELVCLMNGNNFTSILSQDEVSPWDLLTKIEAISSPWDGGLRDL